MTPAEWFGVLAGAAGAAPWVITGVGVFLLGWMLAAADHRVWTGGWVM